MAKIIYAKQNSNQVTFDELPGRAVFHVLKSDPERCYLYDLVSQKEITGSQIIAGSVSLAERLEEMEIPSNNFVTLISENIWQCSVVLLGSSYLGIPVQLLSPTMLLREIEDFLQLTKPKIVFCSTSQVDKILELKSKCNFLKDVIDIENTNTAVSPNVKKLDEIITYDISQLSNNFKLKDIDPDTTAILFNSSGTTGRPKSVMITNRNLAYEFNNLISNLGINNQCSYVLFQPLYHIYGIILLYMTFLSRARCYIMQKFNYRIFLECIDKHRITHLLSLPPIINRLVKDSVTDNYDLSSVRCIVSGAAPLKNEIAVLVEKRFNMRLEQVYGMTELTGVVVSSKDHEGEQPRPLNSGKLLPYMQMKVIDLETNQILPPNHSGELCFKGPYVMKGYLDSMDLTKEIIDDEGFLHTGDIGYYDDEEFIFVVDRIKDLIKFKGFQVSPSEIEDIMMKHPGIMDVAITSKPDEYAGELTVALVVKKSNVEISEDDVINYAKEHLSYHKQLHGGVKFVEAIPKSATGKIIRKELKSQLENLCK